MHVIDDIINNMTDEQVDDFLVATLVQRCQDGNKLGNYMLLTTICGLGPRGLEDKNAQQDMLTGFILGLVIAAEHRPVATWFAEELSTMARFIDARDKASIIHRVFDIVEAQSNQDSSQ